MKNVSKLIAALALCAMSCQNPSEKQTAFRMVCNPIDLNYRFCLEGNSMREAADPSIILYGGESYADAVYVSKNPLGPYTLAAHNPFAYKPEGFACGAGHGSIFRDVHGNY